MAGATNARKQAGYAEAGSSGAPVSSCKPEANHTLKPQFYLGAGRERPADLVQAGGEVFLKASIVSGFCA